MSADVFPPHPITISELFDVERCYLGASVEIGPTGEQGLGPARCLRVYAKDRQRPFLVTVSFDVKLITALPVTPNHAPRVRLAWGSDQGGGEATVDLRHGMRVALEVSDITADAEYHVPAGAAAVGPDIRVVSSIGFGSVGDQRLTLTQDSQTIADGATGADITIPSYARSFEIQSSADPTIAVPNRFLVEIFRGTVAGARMVAADERDVPVTLPNGAETMRLTNLGPGAAIYTLIFHLTL